MSTATTMSSKRYLMLYLSNPPPPHRLFLISEFYDYSTQMLKTISAESTQDGADHSAFFLFVVKKKKIDSNKVSFLWWVIF
jgi:hypothetical protein